MVQALEDPMYVGFFTEVETEDLMKKEMIFVERLHMHCLLTTYTIYLPGECRYLLFCIIFQHVMVLTEPPFSITSHETVISMMMVRSEPKHVGTCMM